MFVCFSCQLAGFSNNYWVDVNRTLWEDVEWQAELLKFWCRPRNFNLRGLLAEVWALSAILLLIQVFKMKFLSAPFTKH